MFTVKVQKNNSTVKITKRQINIAALHVAYIASSSPSSPLSTSITRFSTPGYKPTFLQTFPTVDCSYSTSRTDFTDSVIVFCIS